MGRERPCGRKDVPQGRRLLETGGLAPASLSHGHAHSSTTLLKSSAFRSMNTARLRVSVSAAMSASAAPRASTVSLDNAQHELVHDLLSVVVPAHAARLALERRAHLVGNGREGHGRLLAGRGHMVARVQLLIQKAQSRGEPEDRGRRRGRASRHVHVNWQNRIGAAPHAVVVVEDAARAPASPVRHHNLRIGGRMVGPKRRLPHGARHGPGIDEHIRMARRGHDLYAEALRVEDRGDGGENLDLAAVATGRNRRDRRTRSA